MFKLNKFFYLSLSFFLLSLPTFVFAQETLTITTYYPSPYGSYNQLEVFRSVRYRRQSSFPVSPPPAEGELIYFNDGTPSTKGLYYYDGSAWVLQGAGGGCYVDYWQPCAPGFVQAATLGYFGYCGGITSGSPSIFWPDSRTACPQAYGAGPPMYFWPNYDMRLARICCR